MCTESESDSISNSNSNGWNRAQGLALKSLLLLGGALLFKRLRKSTTRWDHTRLVTQSLTGEKVSFFFLLTFPFLVSFNYSFFHVCICSIPRTKLLETLITISILGLFLSHTLILLLNDLFFVL